MTVVLLDNVGVCKVLQIALTVFLTHFQGIENVYLRALCRDVITKRCDKVYHTCELAACAVKSVVIHPDNVKTLGKQRYHLAEIDFTIAKRPQQQQNSLFILFSVFVKPHFALLSYRVHKPADALDLALHCVSAFEINRRLHTQCHSTVSAVGNTLTMIIW